MGRFEPERYYAPGDPEMRLIATKGTLAVWRCERKGPRYTRFGNRVFYLGSDLNGWLDSHVVEPRATGEHRPAA